VLPALAHLAPALATAFAEIRGVDRKRMKTDKNAITFLFMNKA